LMSQQKCHHSSNYL